MKEIDIKKLNKSELDILLKNLRLYRDLQKNLGSRGKKIFGKILYGTRSYSIEHFDAVSEKLAWENAQEIYGKIFNLSPKKEDVVFIKKASLKGGIKVYLDDEVVDLSFDKVERALKGA